MERCFGLNPLLRILATGLSAIGLLCSPSFAAGTVSEGAQCTAAENYLNTQLTNSSSRVCAECRARSGESFNYLHSVAEHAAQASTSYYVIPAACYKAVMEERGQAGVFNRYASCSTPKAPPEFRMGRAARPAPCINNNLIKAVQVAFAETTACMKVEQSEVFETFGWESHFQPNIASRAGVNSLGLGQLNSIGYKDVDLHHLFAGDKSKPECGMFQDIFKESDARSNGKRVAPLQTCSLIGGIDAMRRNLLYSEAIYRKDKNTADTLTGLIHSTVQDRKLISKEITQAMYNGGLTGVALAFQFWVLRHGNRPTTYRDFKAHFYPLLKDFYGKDTDSRGKIILGTSYKKQGKEDAVRQLRRQGKASSPWEIERLSEALGEKERIADAQRVASYPLRIRDQIENLLKTKTPGIKCIRPDLQSQ